jgi:4-amino-4-deoxy-L-arabinose transferase-like glycosyltransferase
MTTKNGPGVGRRLFGTEEGRRVVVAALALVVALFVVGVVWRAQGLVVNRADPYWFSAMAESLLRGDGFTPYGTLLHRRSPLYPLTIAGIYAIFGTHALAVQIVQALFHVGTCVLAQAIGTRMFNARTGLLAGVMSAVHPALLRYIPDFHLETMVTFLMTLSVWRSVHFAERPTWKNAVWFGVACGLASLTKAVVMLYPAVFAGAFLFFRRKASPEASRPRLPILALAFVAMGLVISPWTIRNYYATGGHFVPIATGMSDAFLRGYVFSKTEYVTLQRSPYEHGENEVNAMFRSLCAAEGTVWERDDLETDRILNKAAKARLVADPLGFVRKFTVGLFAFWYQMTSLKTSLVAGGLAIGAWVLAALGFPRARREGKPVWLLLAPILYLNLLLAALLSLGRYSVPILPCLVVLAAFGVDTVIDRLRARREPAIG